MVVAALIPLLGLTIAQLDIFTLDYFNRATRSMIPEQEIEIAFGSLERDILVAKAVTVYSDGGTWASPVAPATTGDGIEVTLDDNNTPLDATDDDRIRYSLNGDTIVREYEIDGTGFDLGQIVARDVTVLQFTQAVNQPPATENLPAPANVIRVRISATLRQLTVDRTRYITSRAMSAIP